MRHARFLMAAPVLILSGTASWAAGCGTFAEDCLSLSDPDCSKGLGNGNASTTTTTTTTTTTGTSTSTGVVAGCNGMPDDILMPVTIGNYVNEDCGVFVQADALDESGDGTKERPFKTVQAAIAGAKGKAVFLCTTSPFVEKLDISAPLSLYGGFDCTKDWSWDSQARSVVMANPDETPVTIRANAQNVTLWNLAIQAADATKDSGSSIGMAIADVPVTLSRCDVTAGNGKKGLAGTSHPDTAPMGASAMQNVTPGCVAPFAALAGKTTCPDGTKTDGGNGGFGGDPAKDGGKGQSGENGSPAPSGAEGKGGVGDGQPGANICTNGAAGKTGGSVSSGVAGTAKNTILELSGISGGNGGDGPSGKAGQGGGGGGGTRAGAFCGALKDMEGFGPSGGGGGAGGCGGVGGGGGQFGGSSVAILSLGMQLTLTDVALTTGAGGDGGAGGVAQMGGVGGEAAVGGIKAKSGFENGCDGGNGGKGSDGGKGGGGRGGHSIGIAFAGTPTAKLMVQFKGGAAGNGGDSGEKGVGGAPAACWDFLTNTTCAQ